MGSIFGLPLPLHAVSMVFAIVLCVHAVRTHQPMFWLWIILVFQPLGGIVYLIAVLGPELMGGRTARNLGKAASQALDPQRELREARAAYDDAPTVQNMARLAEALGAQGDWAEAEPLYAQAARGLYEDDPALLLGRARALLELGRPAEALEALLPLGDALSAPTQLVAARAHHALGNMEAAGKLYAAAVARLSGFEGLARHAVYLADVGRTAEAKEIVDDLDRRAAKARDQFRREARFWRDFAAEGVAAAGKTA